MITEGPYRYSRNPQYIGTVLVFSGALLFFNSFFASVIGVIGNLLFILTSFVEEAWLKQEFGKEYKEYCERVPRFTGLRSFRLGKMRKYKDSQLANHK